jgi:hypothetical protein
MIMLYLAEDRYENGKPSTQTNSGSYDRDRPPINRSKRWMNLGIIMTSGGAYHEIETLFS